MIGCRWSALTQNTNFLGSGSKFAQISQRGKILPAEEDHVENKGHFHGEEQKATQPLATENAPEAHDNVGDFCFPIAMNEKQNNVSKEIGDSQAKFFEEPSNCQEQVFKKARNGSKEKREVIRESLPFVQMQVF